MIKIIVPGTKPDKTKRFECPTCGCVFDADEKDYYEAESLTRRYYASVCPTCGDIVAKDAFNG